MNKVQLTEISWIEKYRNVLDISKDNFEEMWAERPKERLRIASFGGVFVPRLVQFYGNGSYSFSGITISGEKEIPYLVGECLDCSRELYPKYVWDGALVNWYENGANYIGPHSDDIRGLVEDSPILSYSFGQERIFRIKKKSEVKENEIGYMDVITENNSMVAMCGKMQSQYTHEITKTAKAVGRRINITIRSIKK